MNTTQSTKTTLYIGLKTAEHQTHIHPEEVIDFIQDRVFAGTFKEAKGLWNGETENTLTFECIDLEDNFKQSCSDMTIKDLKQSLEKEFNQDSVMVEQQQIEVAF